MIIGENTYISVTDATAIINRNFLTEQRILWANTGVAELEILLRRSAEMIDALPFHSTFEQPYQKMAFPRKKYGTPEAIKTAQALTAFRLLEDIKNNNRAEARAILQAQGVTAFSIGDLSETYGDKQSKTYLLQDERTASLLRPYLNGGYPIC